MSILFAACGVGVVLVLMIAGMSKWGRADATASALRELGVPDAFAHHLAPALPALELGIAALLLAPRLAWAGAVLATALLAPPFQGMTLAGAALDLRALLQDGRDLLLVFISADCAPCKDLLSDLLFWRNTHQPLDKLVLVSGGSREANLGKLGGLIGNDALLQTGHEINDLFGVITTPSALRIDRDGRIAAPLTVGLERIMALLAAGAPAVAADEARFVRAASDR